jgi:WD40 repeat protein
VKVWRVVDDAVISPSKQKFGSETSTPATPTQITATRTLAGRNCLLGSLVDSIFTCVASISDRVAVICSEKGDICLLEDDHEGTKLVKVGETGFQTACIAVDFECRVVRIGGRSGMMTNLSFDDLIHPQTPLEPASAVDSPGAATLCAMAFIADVFVTVDTHHAIKFFMKDASDQVKDTAPLTAHADAVLGVKLLCQPNQMNAAFYTWSANGKVLFWDLQGRSKGSMQVEVEQSPILEDETLPQNQCQIVRAAKGATFFVTGDKYGILRVLEGPQHKSSFVAKAHATEILGIDIFEGENCTLIASCGRDRTVQLFSKFQNSWTLLQTMDEHTASVCSLFFCENGEKLISCSTDRTVSIRQIASREVNGNEIVMAAIPIRVINLKASPVSMVLSHTDPSGSFVVSLLDRTVATYEILTGRLITSFRAVDNESSDAVVMDALVMGKPSSLPGRPTILAGVSSTDKSVRIYDGSTGAFLDRQHGKISYGIRSYNPS